MTVLPLKTNAATNVRSLGANDRIRIGIIGCGGRGSGTHLKYVQQHEKSENLEVAGICDPYRPHRERAVAKVKEVTGKAPKAFVSYRDLLNMKDLDAIMIASPDHVHTQQSEPESGNSRAIDALTGLILEARNPVIVAGYGCIRSGAQAQVSELSESLNIPVTSSMKGKGVISEQSSLSLGSLGVTSTGYAYKYIIDNADAIIFLGAGFNERTSYLWDASLLHNKKIAQVDSNPEQIDKVFKSDVAVTGDIKSTLNGVLNTLDAQGVDRQAARKQIAVNDPVSQRDAGSSKIFESGFALVESFYKRLERHFPQDLVVFDDNMIFAQSFFNVASGNRFYPNSGVSSLGHAIPAAIGARFAEDKPTLAIIGDGGFQMCCMELMTAVNYDLPITVVMFNNSTMGLIRKNQYQSYEQRYLDCDFVNPDYALLAQSFGIGFQHVESEADLDRLFAETDFSGSSTLVEIMIDKDAFPNYNSLRN